MAAKTISIKFDGYWRDENKGGLPAKSGVYCVYECTHNRTEKTVSLHNKWLKYVRQGNELCFSFGGVSSVDRNRAEAAMIFKHKPPVNDEYKDSFPYDKTTMSLSGKTALLNTYFTVNRTEG